MDLEKSRHLLLGSASESAFGCDPEILRVAKRGREAPPVAFDAAGGVHQPQVELGVADRQIREGFEKSVVFSVAGHRHVHEIDTAARVFDRGIGKVDAVVQVLGLDHVLVPEVPIAKMGAEQRSLGHMRRQLRDRLDETIDGFATGLPRKQRAADAAHR